MANNFAKENEGQLKELLRQMHKSNNYLANAEKLAVLAETNREAQFWQGVNLFLAGKEYYEQARSIFQKLYREGYKEGNYFLGLLNYPEFTQQPNIEFAVDLWSEAEDKYCQYWLSQYALDNSFGPAEYNQAWEYLQNIANDDGAAMELVAFLMKEQEYYFPDKNDVAEENHYKFWWEKSQSLKKESPYGKGNLEGLALKNHVKAYINQVYGKKYPITVESNDKLQQEQIKLGEASPYRGISFIIGGIFLVIFVILTIIHALR